MAQNRLGDNNMVENTIHEMIAIIEEKLELLKVILSTEPILKEAIKKENMDGIATNLNIIQKQIDNINEIDSLYSKKLIELKASTGIDSISQLDDIAYPSSIILKDRLNEIKSVLEAIKTMDDENNLLMNEKFEETKDKLKNLRQGQKMVKGYSADYDETMFIDERN